MNQQELITWLRAIGASSAELQHDSGEVRVTRIDFREPSELEQRAQMEAEVSAEEKAAIAMLGEEERARYVEKQRNELLYGSS